MTGGKIIKNQAKCSQCGQVVESTNIERRKTCSCGHLTIDGGLDQLLREGAHEELAQFFIVEN